jgi:hypothetical protein
MLSVRGHWLIRMPTFDDFMAEIETEAHAQGPEEVDELNAFRLYFTLVRLAHVVGHDARPDVAASAAGDAGRRPPYRVHRLGRHMRS